MRRGIPARRRGSSLARTLCAMPRATCEFHATPNPHALKCVRSAADAGPAPATRAFRSLAEAQSAGDALAVSLLSVPGVSGALIAGEPGRAPAWFTINKSPGASWAPIKKAVAGLVERL